MPRIARLAAALLLTGLLPTASSLAEGGDSVPPPAPVPVEETPGETRTLHLSLEEAVAMALRNNLDLQGASYLPPIAAADLDSALALYDHVFSARFGGGESRVPANTAGLPGDAQNSNDFVNAGLALERRLPWGGTVSLVTTADRVLTNSAFSHYNPYWDTGLGLDFRQPVLRGFGREVTESGIRLAEDQMDIAALDFRRTVEAKVFGVETVYWELVRARGVVDAQQKALDVALDLQRVNEARLKAGAGTKVDVSQAQAGVAAREVDVLRSTNTLRSLEERLLGELVPRTPDLPDAANLRLVPTADAAKDLPPLPSESVAAAVETALVRRTDVRLRRVAVDQAEVGVLRAESGVLSRLDLQAGVRYAGNGRTAGSSWSGSLASRENASWNVGLVLEVPIGNRRARASLQRALLTRARMETLVRAQESDAAVSVRNARRDLESARKEIDAAVRSTALALEQLEAERERLRNDKSTTFSVLILESDLTDARLAELRALADYRVATSRYDYEIGRLLEVRGIAPPPGASK